MFRNRRYPFALAGLVLVGLGMLAPSTHAQCTTGPDGLEFQGTCCALSQPNLPAFPSVTLQDMQYICWRNCNVSRNRNLCVDIAAPTPHIFPNGAAAGCGIVDIPIVTKSCGANPRTIFSGTLLGTYVKTWQEATVAPGPPDVQVWRFMVNGDLTASSFVINRYGNNRCVPQCYSSFNNQVYFAGYIDYRFECTTSVWRVEWALNHECDAGIHNADSARPAPAAGFHPRRSFTFVGPSPFIPTLGTPVFAGPAVQENFRSIGFTGLNPVNCFVDDPIATGTATLLGDFCMCNANGALQYARTDLNGFTQCLSFFNLPSQGSNKDFMQKRIGYFLAPDDTPLRFLVLNMGDLEIDDFCQTRSTVEYFEGVCTFGTNLSFTFDANGNPIPIGPNLLDTGSSTDVNGSKLKGAPHYTDKLLNLNTP